MSSNPVYNPQSRCSALGFFDDPESWVASPSDRNCCHQSHQREVVSQEYQEQVCLSGKFYDCPLYQRPVKKMPVSMRYEKPSKLSPNILLLMGMIVVFALTGVTSAALFFQQQPAHTTIPGGSSLSQVSPSTTLGQTSANSTRLPPAQQVEATPQLTSLPTSAITPDFINETAILLYDSNLREGPGTTHVSLTFVDAGTSLFLAATNTEKNWVLVRLVDGQIGWVARSQLSPSLDLSSLPITSNFLPVTLTPDMQSEHDPPITQSAATPQPLMPDQFSLDVILVDNTICASFFTGVTLRYEFTINGSVLQMYRPTIYSTYQGFYNTTNGSFEATGIETFGSITYSGMLTFDGETIDLSGERRVAWSDPNFLTCDGLWLIEGQTQINRP